MKLQSLLSLLLHLNVSITCLIQAQTQLTLCQGASHTTMPRNIQYSFGPSQNCTQYANKTDVHSCSKFALLVSGQDIDPSRVTVRNNQRVTNQSIHDPFNTCITLLLISKASFILHCNAAASPNNCNSLQRTAAQVHFCLSATIQQLVQRQKFESCNSLQCRCSGV